MKHDYCVACGQSENLNHHHLVPRSIGGSDDDSNLITLCGSCHAKAHQVKADWRHSELISKGMKRIKSLGFNLGTANFGYCIADDGRTLIDNMNEQRIINLIREYRKEGLSLRSIVSRLNKQGHKARSNKPLELTQVARIVKTIESTNAINC